MLRRRGFRPSPGRRRRRSRFARRQVATNQVCCEHAGPFQFCNRLCGVGLASPPQTAPDASALHSRIDATTHDIPNRFRQEQLQIRRNIFPQHSVIRSLQLIGACGVHLPVYAIEGAQVAPSARQAANNEFGIFGRAMHQQQARRRTQGPHGATSRGCELDG